jgi:hypothetical protein
MSVGLAPIEAAELGARSPQRSPLFDLKIVLDNTTVSILEEEWYYKRDSVTGPNRLGGKFFLFRFL